jgi:serine O-acetyltransferase
VATGVDGESGGVRIVLLTQGLWASVVYRICQPIVRWRGPRAIELLLRFGCQLARKVIEVITGISISPQATIGPGLYIGHFGGIFVGHGVRIGANCNLSQGVTIGLGGFRDRGGAPTLADRVWVGPNAVVTGGISIGCDCVLGAGTVVGRTFPDRAIVIGNPAKLLTFDGSFEMVRYEGMETDPERLASIAAGREQRHSNLQT